MASEAAGHHDGRWWWLLRHSGGEWIVAFGQCPIMSVRVTLITYMYTDSLAEDVVLRPY